MLDNTTEHDDFDADAAFNEAAEALSGTPATAAATDDDSHDEQAPEVDALEPAAAEPAAAQTPAENPEVAALKAELARLNHGWNSDRGRLSALTKKLEQLEAHKPEQSLPATTAGMDDDELAQFADDFPEHAAAVERLVQRRLADATKALDERLAQLAQPIQALEQDRAAAVVQQQQQALLTVHPDAYEVAQSPQFAQWLSQQPPQVQQIYQDSDSAQDNIWLLSQFKSAQQQATKQRQQQQTRKLDDMTRLPAKGAGRHASPEDALDDDALFNHLAEQQAKQLSKR